jgi:hypothetical protein
VPIFNPTRCRHCPAQVIMAMSLNNEPMPVNATSDPDGMLELYWRGETLRVRVVPRAMRAAAIKRTGGLYVAHLASCRPPRRPKAVIS